MTVGGLPGDSGGDLATQTPATAPPVGEVVSSPERFIGSRFWVLQTDEEEDDGTEDGEEDVGGMSGGGGDRSSIYLCHTPSPERNTDLVEGSSKLNRCHLKRIRRRDGQRSAGRAALFFSSHEGMISSPPLPLGNQRKQPAPKNLPVLEPTVFADENMDGWTVVRR
jgi:hypothetical protein